jgi:hypothetical protein
LKIRGILEDDGHAYIHAFIVCSPQIKKIAPIVFLVDLGATITTILEGDCIRLGIDCNSLEKAPRPTVVPGGKTETYILRDVFLVFETIEGEMEFEKLEKIDVVKPKADSILLPFSLLGVDIISRFKLTYSKDNGLLLEK